MKKYFLLLLLTSFAAFSQTTGTELKAQIDTDITNKTGANSISKVNVGSNMKDIVDYVDQQSPILFRKVTITHAELLALSTTPKTLVPAESGKVHLPLHILFKFNNNLGWGNSGTPWVAKLDTFSIGSLSMQIGGASVTEQTFIIPAGSLNTLDSFANKTISLNATTNPSSPGDATTTVDVYVTYFTITL